MNVLMLFLMLSPSDALAEEIEVARSLVELGALDLARLRYDRLLRSRKTVQANGTLDAAVVRSEPRLLEAYYELGNLSLRCGMTSRQESLFDDAATVYSNILRIVPPDGALWWQCKYGVLKAHYERGAMPAVRRPGFITDLERVSTVYDGGRFGMKPKFDALMEKIRRRQGGNKE